MIEIQLTRGYVAIVDDCDADLNNVNWQSNITPTGSVYARRHTKDGYFTLHIVIYKRMTNGDIPTGFEIDHIDGNSLNNKRSNLRLATHAQNMLNRKMHANNTTGYTGVWINKKSGRWGAIIRINGKKTRLGMFDTPELASAAYQAKALEVFGEFKRGIHELPTGKTG